MGAAGDGVPDTFSDRAVSKEPVNGVNGLVVGGAGDGVPDAPSDPRLPVAEGTDWRTVNGSCSPLFVADEAEDEVMDTDWRTVNGSCSLLFVAEDVGDDGTDTD